MPLPGQRLQFAGHVIRDAVIREANGLEMFPVKMGKQWLDEVRHRVITEVWRKIADTEFATLAMYRRGDLSLDITG